MFAYQAGLHSVAIETISQAILGFNKHPPMYGNLALAQLADGDLKGAETSCCKALRLNPAYADGHRVFGLVLQQQGKLNQAALEFKRALALGLDTEELRSLLKEHEQDSLKVI